MTNSPVGIAHPAGRVQFNHSEGVGWISLDNPRKHNAMSLQMWRSLINCMERLEADPIIRCIVIRGEGDRAFCAGADIDEKHDVGEEQARENTALVLRGQRAVGGCKKPTIAMVSGYCLGGGLGLALGCDMRVAATSASFGIPAARIGLSYYYNELKRLTDLVGPARAKQLFFTADRISADRALEIGLVENVVSSEELLTFTSNMAKRIAANAPLSIAAARRSIDVAAGFGTQRDIAECDSLAEACLLSEDYAEGRMAFREKRPPVFSGR